MNNLEFLDLSYNNLNNTIWSFLSELSSLKILDLSQYIQKRVVQIEGLQGLCKLKTLRELNIGGIGIGGNLPWCLVNLTSLRLLDISFNHFTGNVAQSPLINLTSLEFLELSDNHFDIPISFKSFFNHSKLKFIGSLNNNFSLEDDHLGSTPTFQLIGLRLSNSKHDSLTTAIPHFLYHQHDLILVELSHIGFSGKFPKWLLENNTRMVDLSLTSNSLDGPLLLPSHPVAKLLALDISHNHLQGFIPFKIGSVFPCLKNLNMSMNNFNGSIPPSIGDMTSLIELDLSYNNLSGEIPVHLVVGCRLLVLLRLANNFLKGPILPPQNNLTELGFLDLDNNDFTEISQSLFRSPHLRLLFVRNNLLEGPILIGFCQLHSLWILDLSQNKITGPLPSCFNLLYYLRYVQLSKNRLRGPFPVAFKNNSNNLQMLDLSDNQFSGNIPNWIGNLSSLLFLLLRNNQFEGNIPNQLCHLSRLTVIDVSFNHLFGTIPPCINNITFKEESRVIFRLGSYQQVIDPLLTSVPHDLRIVSKLAEYQVEDRFTSSLIPVKFSTKGQSLSYKGVVRDLFSGIDLSHNKLTGHIPLEIGNLSNIRALNLSHNNLSGAIPATFSNLVNIESLDLSYNHLDGKIPSQLTELNSLEVFNLSYNNLSGSTPQRVAQFGTFDSSSYVGNPLLCGDPLPRKCNEIDSPPSAPKVINGSEEDSGFMEAFYMSFAGAYVTMLLATVVILYINPNWRRAWFHLVIEVFIKSCYYFVVDNLLRLRRGFLGN